MCVNLASKKHRWDDNSAITKPRICTPAKIPQSREEILLHITVIIPTYNELKNLTAIAEALFSLPLPDLKILVVDDNSPDGTGVLARTLCEQFPGRMLVLERSHKRGLGSAYLDGFQQTLKTGAEAI